MTDNLISSIVKEGSRVHSTILVHAENAMICSEYKRKGREKGMACLDAWA
jgi:hypothetical protein